MSFSPNTFSKKIFALFILTTVASLASAQPVINEFVFNHTGSDSQEYIEIYGEPRSDYSQLAVLEIEGDSTAAGVIDAVFSIGTTNSAGFWSTDSQFNQLENGTVTLLLVREFTGHSGADLDSDNDGVLDSMPWVEIVDSIAVSDGGASDHTYANVVLNRNYDGVPFTVGGASRIPNGVDTNDVNDWERNDFNFGANDFADALNTPNTINLVQTEALKTTIMGIQGRGHLSPVNGQLVEAVGIVTAVAFNGFYLQDSEGDNDALTSDGVFVFTNSGSAATIGDELAVTGVVNESVPGGVATGNLSTTQLYRPSIEILSSNSALPVASTIGRSGRIPPNEKVIGKGETTPAINLYDPADAESNPFNPEEDGIDFYESLEAMLVTVESPSAVSPLRTFSYFSSEVFTLANAGADVAPEDALNSRGGIELQPHKDNRGDQNPERVQIQFDRTLYGEPPLISVGDKLTDVSGVVGYSFGNYEVNATQPVTVMPSLLAPEVTTTVSNHSSVSVASYNVLNLSATADDDEQRHNIAMQIVNNLHAPDVIALQEIQDNNGEIDDGTVDATQTLQALVDNIVAAGGPLYSFITIDPVDGSSGGVPGGNIRNAYLYNADRVELLNYVSLTSEALATAGVSNPSAFNGTRNPLLATFAFNGNEFTVINNHLTSRFGSSPIFGAVQPFIQAGEAEREAQAGMLNEYVDLLLAKHDDANVIVLGDLNTFQWTNDLKNILSGKTKNKNAKGKSHRRSKRILYNLVDTLEDDAVYSYIFDGNSQVLDHMFVTKSLKKDVQFDIVHVNNDFPRIDSSTASDHEPVVAVFKFDTDDYDED